MDRKSVLMELGMQGLHPKRVCIIGAGAAGLVAIRHVSESPSMVGTVFEMSNNIGGIWVYSDEIGYNRTPMYKNMRTNLPKEIMRFLDMPFNGTVSNNGASFVSHFEVVKYFEDYANVFRLWDHIRFNSRVLEVKPRIIEDSINGKEITTWEVLVEQTLTARPQPLNLTSGGICRSFQKYYFDSVIVCSGNFSYPMIPYTHDISNFEGLVMHSRDYREPNEFTGKTVLLVGRGPSGVDIAMEIAAVANEVIISSRQKVAHKSAFPGNVRQFPQIKSVLPNGFIFDNDEQIHCDVLIWCTGYQCHFPFLSNECGVNVQQGKNVSPLYKHMIHANFPSLCFIGVIFQTIPFMFFDCQVRYYVKYLEGFIRLPNSMEMIQTINAERNVKLLQGYSIDMIHELGSEQWEYFRSMAVEAGFTFPALSVVQEIYEKTAERRASYAAYFKNDMVRIIDDHTFEYKESEVSSFS